MIEPPRDHFFFLLRRLTGYLLFIALLATSTWLWAMIFTWFGG